MNKKDQVAAKKHRKKRAKAKAKRKALLANKKA